MIRTTALVAPAPEGLTTIVSSSSAVTNVFIGALGRFAASARSGGGGPTIPVVTAAAATASAPETVPIAGVNGSRPKSGACESHESGPIANRSLPNEMARNARTTRGSNCAPAQ